MCWILKQNMQSHLIPKDLLYETDQLLLTKNIMGPKKQQQIKIQYHESSNQQKCNMMHTNQRFDKIPTCYNSYLYVNITIHNKSRNSKSLHLFYWGKFI